METIDLSDIDKEQADGLSRWASFGAVSFRIKYASPRQATKFRRRLEHLGIMKSTDIIKQAEYCAEWAKEYVLDWKGVTLEHQPIPYDSGRMGTLMFSHASVFKLLHDAVQEDEGFFGQNGNGSSPS